MYLEACKTATLVWLVDFANSAVNDYYPRKGKEPEPEENCLTTKDDAEKLREMALKAIREAATDGRLLQSDIAWTLFRWRDLAGDEGKEARDWTGKQLDRDEALAPLAKSFTGEVFSQGIGMFGDVPDLVGERKTKANVKSMDIFMDRDRFRDRLEEVEKRGTLPPEDLKAIGTLLKAWRDQESGRSRDD
jgi:hypothetical protein